MKKVIIASLAACMLLGGAGVAAAYPHDNSSHHSGWNNNWRKGGRMDQDNWRHGSQVDWRSHHLRQPPRGYEWREVNGRYVMAAVATGIIADIILNSH